MTDVVAEFGAYVSLDVDGQTVLSSQNGRVRLTRTGVAFATQDDKRTLALEDVVAFDFRTVPEEWADFFDDLVGVRFQRDGAVVTATIGTDTETIDQFTTVLLKLLLEPVAATVRQVHVPTTGERKEKRTAETELTLHPGRERITFADGADLETIDVRSVTGVTTPTPDDSPPAVVVRHLAADGRLQTMVVPDSGRKLRFLRNYLQVRMELSATAGPLQLLFVGSDRDPLRPAAKRLTERNLDFELSHAETGERALEMLSEEGRHVDCVLGQYQLDDMDGHALGKRLGEADVSVPLVVFTTKDPTKIPGGTVPLTDALDFVKLDESTTTYDTFADAIERAVVKGRTNGDVEATPEK